MDEMFAAKKLNDFQFNRKFRICECGVETSFDRCIHQDPVCSNLTNKKPIEDNTRHRSIAIEVKFVYFSSK
jgi:hypothetical protein